MINFKDYLKESTEEVIEVGDIIAYSQWDDEEPFSHYALVVDIFVPTEEQKKVATYNFDVYYRINTLEHMRDTVAGPYSKLFLKGPFSEKDADAILRSIQI